jgi:hypothetical protein
MPDDDAYRVELPAMTAHAGDLDHAAEQVRHARSAAATVALETGAYGRLLLWLPPLISYLQDTVISGLTDGEQAVREVADDVRLAARGYAGNDHAAARSYLDVLRG